MGTAIIQCGEFKTVDEVVFAQPGDLLLLGARTLEGFNAVVDSRKKKLVPAGPISAAPAGRRAGWPGVEAAPPEVIPEGYPRQFGLAPHPCG